MLRSAGAALILIAAARTVSGDPLNCTLADYTPQPGLTATVAGEALTLVWEAERGSEVRLQLANERGAPIVEELAFRNRSGTSGRQIVRATDLAPFGRHRCEVPFDVANQKCVRFAAWDSAGNGALVQPIKLER